MIMERNDLPGADRSPECLRRRLAAALPHSVIHFLIDAARFFHNKGVDLVLFGSFAEGRQRPKSDLDLGLIWRQERDSVIYQDLVDRLEKIPTIRPVDLVDFSLVNKTFEEKTRGARIQLADL